MALAQVPRLLYGTAWKEERTRPLVEAALAAGFRGIDTANQRKHYHEAGVGEALQAAFATGLVRRDELFLQTKFTYARGQDHRLPYDPRAPPAAQVAQSFASSLAHLGVETVDAYLLHGPSVAHGLSALDHETWQAMEALQREGRVARLGVSNVAIDQLVALWTSARVKPSVVQNRTFTRPGADSAVRAFCAEHGLVYEGFSLLTAIPHVLADTRVQTIATRLGRSAAEVLFAWCLAKGMIVLTGTTSPEHMRQDLSSCDITLEAAEHEVIARLVA